MKTRTKQCGVFAALAAVLLLSAALVTSCPEPVGPGSLTVPQEKGQTPFVPPAGNTGSQLPERNTGSQPEEEDTDFLPPEELGYLQLNIAVPESGARTIMPNTSAIVDLDSFTSFDVYVLQSDGTTVVTSNLGISQTDVADPIPLGAGSYVVRVFGNLTPNGAVAVGEDTATITAGSGDSVSITLREIVDGEGNGTFAWALTAAAVPATSAIMSIIPLSATGTDTHQPYENDLVTTPELSGSVSLKSGYYRVEIAQTRADHKTVKTISALHVYQGFTSTYTYTLPSLKPIVYQVTFNLNGSADTAPASQTINHGARVSKPADPSFLPSGPTAGIFAGWCYDIGGTTPFGFNDTETTGTFVSDDVIIRALTLYAKWTPVYTVTFNYNDGETPAAYQTAYVPSGGKVTKPSDPSHRGNAAGNSFAGWYTNATTQDNTTEFTFDGLTPNQSIAAITGNLPLYAKWLPIYTVTFDYNDGVASPTYQTANVVSGGKVTKPGNPTHRGNSTINTFASWHTSATTQDNTTEFTFDGLTPNQSTAAITGNITLYAKWNTVSSQNLVVSITSVVFDAGGVDPIIYTPTNPATVNQTGATIVFTVTNGTGNFEPNYQWWVDGTLVQTSPSFTFNTSVVDNQVLGTYEIVVMALPLGSTSENWRSGTVTFTVALTP